MLIPVLCSNAYSLHNDADFECAGKMILKEKKNRRFGTDHHQLQEQQSAATGTVCKISLGLVVLGLIKVNETKNAGRVVQLLPATEMQMLLVQLWTSKFGPSVSVFPCPFF